jgi:hypothetical protein
LAHKGDEVDGYGNHGKPRIARWWSVDAGGVYETNHHRLADTVHIRHFNGAAFKMEISTSMTSSLGSTKKKAFQRTSGAFLLMERMLTKPRPSKTKELVKIKSRNLSQFRFLSSYRMERRRDSMSTSTTVSKYQTKRRDPTRRSDCQV